MNEAIFTLHSDVPREGPGEARNLDEQGTAIALWRRNCDQFGYALAVVRPR